MRFILILEKFSVSALSYRSVGRGLTCSQQIDPATIVHWLRCGKQHMRGRGEITIRDRLNTQDQGNQATSLDFTKIN